MYGNLLQFMLLAGIKYWMKIEMMALGTHFGNTVKPVCDHHLYNKVYYVF